VRPLPAAYGVITRHADPIPYAAGGGASHRLRQDTRQRPGLCAQPWKEALWPRLR
jgi:hypothetical protein